MPVCEEMAELWPWLLNGTLDTAEQQQLREHLAGCARCRQELGETAYAMSVYRAHPSADELLDYAYESPAGQLPPGLTKQHLAICPACAEQVELARESRSLESEQDDAGKVLRPARFAGWYKAESKWLAVAAAAAGVVFLAGWLLTLQQVRELQATLSRERGEMQQRLTGMEGERGQLQQEVSQLQGSVRALASPALNALVLDLFPSTLLQRSVRNDMQEVKIPPGFPLATLMLHAQSPSTHASYSVEIQNSGGQVIWSGAGLKRQATNDYTLSIPSEFLSSGDYRIQVYGHQDSRRFPLETFRVRIVH